MDQNILGYSVEGVRGESCDATSWLLYSWGLGTKFVPILTLHQRLRALNEIGQASGGKGRLTPSQETVPLRLKCLGRGGVDLLELPT